MGEAALSALARGSSRSTLPQLAAVLVAESPATEMLGFAELSIRTDLAGLEGKRVGYVEGLYVLPELRGGGVVRRLLRASRSWARQQNCDAFASDRAERIIVDPGFSRVANRCEKKT